MFAVKLCLFLGLSLCCCAFSKALEFMDFEDPLEFIWKKKHPYNSDNRCSALVNTDVVDGTCMNPAHCLLTGGSIGGFCNAITACCVSKYKSTTCDVQTSEKVSYFQGSADQAQTCQYSLRINNPNVCQVRLDFIEFMGDRPTLQSNKFICRNYLDVTPNHYGIPKLCGDNRGQHVYVHVNHSEYVHLNLRASKGDAWNIKVTQLECPRKLKNFASKNLYELAPLGAIQYFTRYSGKVWSFINHGSRTSGVEASGYTGDEFYAIAFKRYENVCGLRLKQNYLKFGYNGLNTDDGCDKDFLFIPALTMTQPIFMPNDKSKVCQPGPVNKYSYVSLPPGPLYMYFDSRNQQLNQPQSDNLGFDFDYELIYNDDDDCEISQNLGQNSP